MLSRLRRDAATGPATVNLVIVTVFSLIVSALLAQTWLDSRAVSADLRGAITPQLSTAQADPGITALLEQTGTLTERFAVRLLPIAASLGRAADATGAAATDADATRENTRSTAEALASLDVSVSAVRTLAGELAPLVVAAVAGTGDIGTHLAAAEQQARAAERLIVGVLGHVNDFAGDARTLRARTKAIEATLDRIERHGKRIARADVLDCPAKLRACLPDTGSGKKRS